MMNSTIDQIFNSAGAVINTAHGVTNAAVTGFHNIREAINSDSRRNCPPSSQMGYYNNNNGYPIPSMGSTYIPGYFGFTDQTYGIAPGVNTNNSMPMSQNIGYGVYPTYPNPNSNWG